MTLSFYTIIWTLSLLLRLSTKKFIVFFVLLIVICNINQTFAAPKQVEYIRGTVLQIEEIENQSKSKTGVIATEKILVKLTSGNESGQEISTIHQITDNPAFNIQPKVGDKVIIATSEILGRKNYSIADFDRIPYTYYFIGAFILSLLMVDRKVGLKSLFVVAFAIFIVLQGMIPLVLKYNINIIIATLLTSSLIATVTQVVVSGWNEKTFGAILGTIGGVIIAGILAFIAIFTMHLTGLDSEESIMLKATFLAHIDFKDVLFAGIVLGALGAVMDVSISISSAQCEVKKVCPSMNFKDLFKSGINVGRDVMGTMSNTLILAYLGSSLPLVLLLSAQTNISLLHVINLNLIITEFARAITGSIGLICAIPFTALITAFLLTRKDSLTDTSNQ